MFKQYSIKTTIFSFVGLMLVGIMILQILFFSLLHKKSNESIYSLFESMVQNTAEQINDINNNVADISFSLSLDSNIQSAVYINSPYEHVKNLKVLQSTIDDYKMREENIIFLSVINKSKIFLSSANIPLYNSVRDIVKDIKGHDIKKTNYSTISYNGNSYFACITPIFPVSINYSLNDTHDNYVIALYTIPTENYMLHDYITSNSNNDLIEMFITDSTENIILSSNTDKVGSKIELSKNYKNQFLKTLPIDNTNWFLTIKTLPKNISSLSNISTLYFILMCILYIVVLTFILKLLNSIIIKRITLFKKNALQINDNDTTYRIKYPHKDELNEVVSVLNHVLDKLHSANHENIKALTKLHNAEIMQKETQIYYLEGQLSPHFLYNSMSYIQGVALEHNVKEIADIAISMSKVFRYISNNQSISNVGKDLNYAIDYFNVINMRRYYPITLINNIEDDTILSVPCLKNIFQPIFENILKHAFDLDSTGTVIISSIKDEDKVIFEISDDGKGISHAKMNELNNNIQHFKLDKEQVQTSIGILNVHTRLKLYYNNDSGLHIISNPGKGTRIQIIFDKTLPNSDVDINF